MNKIDKLDGEISTPSKSSHNLIIGLIVSFGVIIIVLMVVFYNDLAEITSTATPRLANQSQSTTGVATTEAVEKLDYVGDIGTLAQTEALETTVHKLDCSQTSLGDEDGGEVIVSQRGKLCVVEATIKNISDEDLTLSDQEILLHTWDTRSYYVSDTQYRYQPDLAKSLGGDYAVDGLDKNRSETVKLVFDIPLVAAPERLTITAEENQAKLVIYLDDASDDYGFECRSTKLLAIDKTVRDCAYEYTLNDILCEQTIALAEDKLKFCVVDYTMTNISHLADVSPYIPNIPYNYVGSGFHNHAPKLVDEGGNLYDMIWLYPYIYIDDQSIEIALPKDDYENYIQSLAPGDSIDRYLIFSLTGDDELEALKLVRYTFNWYYSASFTEGASKGVDSASSSLDVLETNSSSAPASNSRSDCPTCGRRDRGF